MAGGVPCAGEVLAGENWPLVSDPSLSWPAAARPALAEGQSAGSAGGDGCFGERCLLSSTALPTATATRVIVVTKLITDPRLSRYGSGRPPAYVVHEQTTLGKSSPDVESTRLRRRGGFRMLGNRGFFTFSSPSFSGLMLFCAFKSVHERSLQSHVRMWIVHNRIFIHHRDN